LIIANQIIAVHIHEVVDKCPWLFLLGKHA